LIVAIHWMYTMQSVLVVVIYWVYTM